MVMMKTNPPPTVSLPPKPLPVPPPAPGDIPKHLDCIPGPEFPKPGSFEAKDANNDGKLNADEFDEGRGLIDKLKDPDKFDRYDADNDGYVSKTENAMGEFRDAVNDYRKSQQTLPGGKKFEPGVLKGKAEEGPKAEAELSAELPELPAFKRGAARTE